MADGWCPNTFSMLGSIEELDGFYLFQRIACIFPVNQIFGMENGQTGSTSEAGSRHIKIFSYRTDIRIGIIGIQHRIDVCAILLVRYPGFGYILGFRLPTGSA